MSIKSELAAELRGRFCCSQAVLGVFCEDYDLDTETAMKVSCSFGGGCGNGEICGAASGGISVVGLKYGQYIPDDMGTKANCRAKTLEFTDEFRKRNGALRCCDILGFDIRDAESYTKAREDGVLDRLCGNAVKSAVEILEELGY